MSLSFLIPFPVLYSLHHDMELAMNFGRLLALGSTMLDEIGMWIHSHWTSVTPLTKYDDIRHYLAWCFKLVFAFVSSADVMSLWPQRSYVTISRRIPWKGDQSRILRWTWYICCDIIIVLPRYWIIPSRRCKISGAIQDGVLTSQHDHILRSRSQVCFCSWYTHNCG